MPNWTDAQLDAIKARRGTVLVSAAAGSGKTAVLVERVIERLTDPEHPTDADRLLVVTFTKAAAAEMRDRIEKRLLALMKEQPENPLAPPTAFIAAGAHLYGGQLLFGHCARILLPARYLARFLHHHR